MKIVRTTFEKNYIPTNLHFSHLLYKRCTETKQCSFFNHGKAVPLQAWCNPEGFRRLSFPDFITTARDGGTFVSLTHRPTLPPGNAPGTHFC